MTHDVFISYAIEDKHIADAICANLEINRIRCWIAPRDITPGTKFASAIIDAIDTTQLVVFVFSQYSDNSPYVRTEIERAFVNEKVIIPFRIENIEPSGEMSFFIGSRHWLDAMSPPLEDHINRLSKIVLKNLNKKNGDNEVQPPPSHKLPVVTEKTLDPLQKNNINISVSSRVRRFLAYSIDIICGFGAGIGFMFLTQLIVRGWLGSTQYSQFAGKIFGQYSPFYNLFLGLSFAIGFSIWIMGFDITKRSQSLGKRLLKMKISPDSTVLQPKSWRYLRSFVKNSPFIIFIIYTVLINPVHDNNVTSTWLIIITQIVLAIPLFFSEKNQAVHDILAGTVVNNTQG